MNEKPEECETCNYPTEALTQYSAQDMPGQMQGRKKWLCDLCASTETGRIYDYPGQFERQTAILRTICFVGNTILDALKRS